jgi:NAD dependent epimerase/dehydratase family enzyme
MGVGGKIGSGRQWMGWVDLQDILGAIHHLLKTDSLNGPVNLVAPNPVTNAEFTKILASVLSRPAIFPMPAFAARLAFGQMADELLMASQRVDPSKLIATGYAFRFGDLRTSLKAILSR